MKGRIDEEHALMLLRKAQEHLDRCGRRLAAAKVEEAIEGLRRDLERQGGEMGAC